MTDSAKTAHQHAYDYIRDQIRSGSFSGGRRVKPEDIAATLGLSRMPVREAIRQLDAEGLLTMRPNRGAVVTELSGTQILELFEMRAVLEGLAMRSAVLQATEDDHDELTVRLRRMRRAAHDADLWIKRHGEFHDFACGLSGRERLAGEITRLRGAVEPYLRISLLEQRIPEDTADEHQLIVDAFEKRDSDHAESVMRQHVLSTAVEISSFFNRSVAGGAPTVAPHASAGSDNE